jgi:hypothetical protein
VKEEGVRSLYVSSQWLNFPSNALWEIYAESPRALLEMLVRRSSIFLRTSAAERAAHSCHFTYVLFFFILIDEHDVHLGGARRGQDIWVSDTDEGWLSN